MGLRCDFNNGDLIDDRYVVEEKLGEGSFGLVFKVKDGDNGVFALKLLKLWEVFPNERQYLIERFKIEYEAGQIKSDYLVPSFAYGTVKDIPYIVMEFCPNGDVKKQCERPDFDLIKTCTEVLYGLYDLHSKGMVHRDLKPENILIKSNGVNALTDFGFTGDKNHRITKKNLFGKPLQIFGTYAYMPPEQSDPAGSNSTILPATDIFAFGVVLYRLITGALPFGPLRKESDIPDYVNRVKKGDWDKKKFKEKNKYPYLENLIEGCFIPKYKDRIQSAAEALSFFPLNHNYILSRSDRRYQKDVVNGFLLRVIQGEDDGAVYKLNDMLKGKENILTVGRLEPYNSNSISITENFSNFISRKHCTLEWEWLSNRWRIKDGQSSKQATVETWNNSTNGTYVNTQHISSAGTALRPGDIISIGNARLRVEGY
ncbi:MAG: protein kinase [Tannerella sp.]|nr:protein kinase [Tannerella sp.]